MSGLFCFPSEATKTPPSSAPLRTTEMCCNNAHSTSFHDTGRLVPLTGVEHLSQVLDAVVASPTTQPSNALLSTNSVSPTHLGFISPTNHPVPNRGSAEPES